MTKAKKKTKKQLWHDVNGPDIPQCKRCPNPVKWDTSIGNYRAYCSHKCYTSDPERMERVRKTNLQKYGVEYYTQTDSFREESKQTLIKKYGSDHPMKIEEFREKAKETNLDKYGTEYASQSQAFREKVSASNMKKYGVEHVTQHPEFQEKSKQTVLERYGVENVMQNPTIKDKQENTTKNRYGVRHALQHPDFQEQFKRTNVERLGVEYPTQSELVKEKIRSVNKIKYGIENYTQQHMIDIMDLLEDKEWMHHQYVVLEKSDWKIGYELGIEDTTVGKYRNKHGIPAIFRASSQGERDLADYLESLGVLVVRNNRDLITNPLTGKSLEVDIWLPEYDIGIEYNGDYWHSIEDKTELKYELLQEIGIQLFVILESEWKSNSTQIQEDFRQLLAD